MDTPPRDVGVCSNKAIRSIRTLLPETQSLVTSITGSGIQRLNDLRMIGPSARR